MRTRTILPFVGATLAVLAMLVSGCSSTGGAVASSGHHDQASGSKLWAQNCARCHNYRTPDSYSDSQWEVAMLHMRIRANLTSEEHRAVLEFLRNAN